MKKASHVHLHAYGADAHVSMLRSRGLKATSQRLAIFCVLAEACKPLALHEIAEQIPEGVANQSTLYRAMHDLTMAGLVRKVDFRHTHAHYELVSNREQHHLICTTCGDVEEFTSPRCEQIKNTALLHSEKFASISDHSLELYGLCKRCAQGRTLHVQVVKMPEKTFSTSTSAGSEKQGSSGTSHVRNVEKCVQSTTSAKAITWRGVHL